MWADNETAVDLLGFDHLVGQLVAVLEQPALLPLTVGVTGEWGSGKSSLIAMAHARLAEREGYVPVAFSPWRHEGYEDIKTALMASVIAELDRRVDRDLSFGERARERLASLTRRVNWFGAARTAGSVVAAAAGAPPEVAALGTQGAEVFRDAPSEAGARVRDVATFREEFAALLEEIEGLQAVVVFIDDLDRCLTETIVETFEAIRLFLHVPRTAYVIAAHQRIVEAAVAGRYPIHREGDERLGADYLEKILQFTVTLPPLSEAEAETYINLLFAQLHLEPDAFGALRAEARSRRQRDLLAPAMNHGVAGGVLGDLPAALQDAFALANRIAPILSRGLRGNPRQIKRFLNTMLVRQTTARTRDVELDAAVLTKLMLLEQLHEADFRTLFELQAAQDGQPRELAEAEGLVRRRGAAGDVAPRARAWAEDDRLAAWLALDPELGPLALGRYFYFSRDRLSFAAPAARLPVALQELLQRLQAPGPMRTAGVREAAALPDGELDLLYEALLERALRAPDGEAMDSARELAAERTTLVGRLIARLGDVPPRDIPGTLPGKLATSFEQAPAGIDDLFERWARTGTARLKSAVAEVRKRTGGG